MHVYTPYIHLTHLETTLYTPPIYALTTPLRDDRYNHLDLPLLNRFEKQLLNPEDVLGGNSTAIVDQLKAWVNQVRRELY